MVPFLVAFVSPLFIVVVVTLLEDAEQSPCNSSRWIGERRMGAFLRRPLKQATDLIIQSARADSYSGWEKKQISHEGRGQALLGRKKWVHRCILALPGQTILDLAGTCHTVAVYLTNHEDIHGGYSWLLHRTETHFSLFQGRSYIAHFSWPCWPEQRDRPHALSCADEFMAVRPLCLPCAYITAVAYNFILALATLFRLRL